MLNRALYRGATEGVRDCDMVVLVVEALRYGCEDAQLLARIPREDVPDRFLLSVGKAGNCHCDSQGRKPRDEFAPV